MSSFDLTCLNREEKKQSRKRVWVGFFESSSTVVQVLLQGLNRLTSNISLRSLTKFLSLKTFYRLVTYNSKIPSHILGTTRSFWPSFSVRKGRERPTLVPSLLKSITIVSRTPVLRWRRTTEGDGSRNDVLVGGVVWIRCRRNTYHSLFFVRPIGELVTCS